LRIYILTKQRRRIYRRKLYKFDTRARFYCDLIHTLINSVHSRSW